MGRFLRQATLPSVGAFVVIGWLRRRTDSWLNFIGADLALLAGLTIQHLIVVAASDRLSRFSR